jgi:hypothetical protein
MVGKVIVEAIISAASAVAAWLPTLFPVVAVPAFVAGIPASVGNVSVYLDGLDPWVPLPLVVTAIGAWALCLAASVVIKVARIALSFLTAGGGSAA